MITILKYTDLHTGIVTDKELKFIGSINKCHNVYISNKGEYYTKGIAGWINVDKYIKG
jgi:hypothetical protein